MSTRMLRAVCRPLALVSVLLLGACGGGGGDEGGPRIVATSPVAGATEVGLDAVVRIAFSEAIDLATLSTYAGGQDPASVPLLLSDSLGQAEPAGLAYDAATNTVILTPDNYLWPNEVYTVTVRTGVRDAAGKALEQEVSWSFVTGDYLLPPPPPPF